MSNCSGYIGRDPGKPGTDNSCRWPSDFEHLLALCKENNGRSDLLSFISRHPELAFDALMVTVQKAIRFLTDEAKRFGEIRMSRDLTVEEEKEYGNNVLIPMLDTSRTLLARLRKA